MRWNTGKAEGARVVSRPMQAVFNAFDTLPAELRQVLNEANHKYDPVWIAEQWKNNRRDRTAAEFARDMKAYFERFERDL